MNRRRGWIVLTFGLLLAIGTGAMVFLILQQQQRALIERAQSMAAIEAPPPVATLQLPVAARPLPPGTVLTAEDFLLKEFPLDLVPVEAITTTISLESQIIVEPIGQGETFSTSKFAGSANATPSQKLKQGYVLYAFPIEEDLLSTTTIIRAGDRIDLTASLEVDTAEGRLEPVTFFSVQNIEVFEVLRPGDVEENSDVRPITLLLTVTPEDLVLIKHIVDSNAFIDLVLRSPLDTEPFDVPPVNREDLIARYGLR